MRTRNRILILLVLALSVFCLPSMAFADDESIFTADNIRYRILDGTENTVEVIHSTEDNSNQNNVADSTYSGVITIPATVQYNGTSYSVVGIDTFAFLDASISSITLPEGLQYIDGAAFAGSDLTSITVPASVTRLGGGGNNTGVFGLGGEGECSLTSVTFAPGSKLTSIEGDTFESCGNLTTLEIPAGVTDLGLDNMVVAPNVIRDLGVLDGLGNPEIVTFAADSPFSKDENGVLYQGDTLIVALNDEIRSVEVRPGTTKIGDNAFYMCTKLAEISLPEGLQTIGDDAFNYAPNVNLSVPSVPGMPGGVGGITIAGSTPANIVEKINIPSTVTSIGTNFLKGGTKEDGTTTVLMQGTKPPTFGTGAFATKSADEPAELTIFYPAEAADAYKDSACPLSAYITAAEEEGGQSSLQYSLILEDCDFEPGDSASFTAVVPDKGKLSVQSSNENVATVTVENNIITITGVNDGTATITGTITLDDLTLTTVSCTVSVSEPPYTGKYSYEVFTSVGDNGTISVDRYATEGDKVTIEVAPDEAYLLDELVVTANGKEVELTDNGDGTYTFTMPSADVKISATFAEDPDWTEPEEPATDVSDIFIDVAPNAWYKDAVQYAYAGGLMTGVSANEFAPDATTTRGMIVSMLARLEGVESANDAGFADVEGEWYATAVNWAASVGVVNGYEDNTFRPNDAITREQLAAILMNYAAYKGEDVNARASLDAYSDAENVSTWATDTMQWAVAKGLLTGVTADTLQPQGAATRAQVAAISQRFLSE